MDGWMDSLMDDKCTPSTEEQNDLQNLLYNFHLLFLIPYYTVPPTVSISANITGSLTNGCETPGNMLCPLIGEMVTVSCAVTGTSSYMISGPRGTSNSMDLVINSFQESDAGTYQCTASNPPCGLSNDSIPIIFTGMFVCLVVCVHECVYVFVCYSITYYSC